METLVNKNIYLLRTFSQYSPTMPETDAAIERIPHKYCGQTKINK